VNVSDSTTPAGTPAAGRPFAGIRRRVAELEGGVLCDECGTELDPRADRCPACSQRRRRRAGLETVIDTYAGDRPWLTVERPDPGDGATGPELASDDDPEGWPW
jgi:hypothetical protein